MKHGGTSPAELAELLATPLDELEREGGYFHCDDCGGEFESFPGDTQRLCGNCSATTHLPRCAHRSIVDLGLGALAAHYCMRPTGHTGQHSYGRKRS